MDLQSFHEEYARLAHAVQSGVAAEMHHDLPAAGFSEEQINVLKHLRVGIDTAKADIGTISDLLIRKGLVTEDEVFTALLDGMRAEVKRYEKYLSEKFGANVTLS